MTPARLLRRLVLLEEGEAPALLWSAAYFFLLLFGYYLLRPVREAIGIARGADRLPWLMTGTLLVMALANPAFAALVSRLPRRRFIPAAYRCFALTMLAFFLAFRFLPHRGGPALGYAFYIWLSVFNLFVVSVFWGLMSDVWSERQGQRLFGFIATGGTLGAIAGAALTGLLTKGFLLGSLRIKVDPLSLLLLSMVTVELAVQCVGRLAAIFKLGDVAHGPREPGPGPLEGLRLIATSRYLQLICAYMLLFTITSTFLYLQQGAIVERAFSGTAARTAAFARIDLWVNVLTLATQVFLTGRIITTLGIPFVLAILPVLTLGGFGALWLWPTFGVMALFQVLRRGLHYAVDRPAREILYIPLGPEERYKAKPFVDTFVYRSGDLLGVWAPTALAALALPVGLAAVGCSGLWLGSSLALGRRVKGAGSQSPD
ncbi:MAG: MFS transporter [Holophagaceae bacterium]|uniref:MFS transporter n=1 Tax=Candidatus Geothrix skivensis TaxID=2954439 RepID=A0A9D7SGK1_9BACT|nr:MFS transporter [Candidatus Geothrix skivensis]